MNETKTDMMLNGICMVCENKDTLCTHIGQVKEECPFIQKAVSTKITNAMRIRSMTDEELAEFLENEKIRDEHNLCSDFGNGCYYSCKKNHACHDNIKQLYIEWLQSEAE